MMNQVHTMQDEERSHHQYCETKFQSIEGIVEVITKINNQISYIKGKHVISKQQIHFVRILVKFSKRENAQTP